MRDHPRRDTAEHESRTRGLQGHRDDREGSQERSSDCEHVLLLYARSRMLLTDFACHCPPRAVAIPPGINHPLTIAIHDAARVCVRDELELHGAA
jgi:hypothetical protein